MNYKEYLEKERKGQLQKIQPKNISVEQASKLIGKSQQWVRIAMQRNIINIGTCIKRDGCKRYDYYINPTLLYKYLGKEPFRFNNYIL